MHDVLVEIRCNVAVNQGNVFFSFGVLAKNNPGNNNNKVNWFVNLKNNDRCTIFHFRFVLLKVLVISSVRVKFISWLYLVFWVLNVLAHFASVFPLISICL